MTTNEFKSKILAKTEAFSHRKGKQETLYRVTLLVDTTHLKSPEQEFALGVLVVSEDDINDYGFTKEEAKKLTQDLPVTPWAEIVGLDSPAN